MDKIKTKINTINKKFKNYLLVVSPLKKYLKSASSFTQYVIDLENKPKLITLIGEKHGETFECPKDIESISVEDYINNVAQNPKSKILVEFSDIETAKKFNSLIPKIIDKLESTGKLDKIYPYDCRDIFFNDVRQRKNKAVNYKDFLYYGHEKFYQDLLNYPLAIVEDFVFILDFSNPIFSINLTQYSSKTIDFFNRYIQDIEKDKKLIIEILEIYHFYKVFQKIPIQLPPGRNEEKITFMIQNMWKKVADFCAMKEILVNNDIDEICFFGGQKHIENLNAILNKEFKLINLTGSKTKCIKLYEVFNIENLEKYVEPKFDSMNL